jgi:hypothetical protein
MCLGAGKQSELSDPHFSTTNVRKAEKIVKGNSIIDRVPDPVWSGLMAASGFIAAHAFNRKAAEVILATHFKRTTAITVAVCLGALFLLTRRRFPGFGNVSLWLAAFCVGFIYR